MLKSFYVPQVLHNIDPIRKFAAIRVGDYKLIINQDDVYKTTWLPRYDVEGELDTLPQPSTLPGAVIKCGKWHKSERTACINTDKLPCLFNIKKGKYIIPREDDLREAFPHTYMGLFQ